MKGEVERLRAERLNGEARIRSLRGKYGKVNTPEKRKELGQEILEVQQSLPEIPEFPRLLVDDATSEVLADLMAANDERISNISAEGGVFDIIGGRYNKIPNLDVYLKGHCGDPIRVDRRSRPEPVMMNNPALTICISPQPGVVQGLSSKPEFRNRGFLARFIYVLPKSALGFRKIDTQVIPIDVRNEYHCNIQALLDIPWHKDDRGNKISESIRLSPKAYRVWAEFYENVEVNLRAEGCFKDIPDWAGKLPGMVARLAGILHCMDHLGSSLKYPVSEATMNGALELGTALIGHATAAFDLMGADPDIEVAKHILKWINQNGADRFSARDCHRDLRGRYPKMDQIQPGLTILIERGFLREDQPPKKNGPGRPPGTKFTVNPKLFEVSS